IANLSDIPKNFLRVELPHLDDKITEFRGPAPTTLTRNLNAVEFSSPHLTIRRVLCVDTTPCAVPPQSMPSVVITLSPTTILHNGHPTKIPLGFAVAIAPNQPFEITPATP